MKITKIYNRLAFPFAASEIEWRLLLDKNGFNGQRTGLAAPYVKARAIQDRLDKVVGPDHWQSDPTISVIQSKELIAVTCRIAIYDDDIGWVWKGDGAGGTSFETIKGGFSGALKRAACQWSIGRYLYSLPDFWTCCIEKKKDKFELTKNAVVDDLNMQYIKALTAYMQKNAYSAEDIRLVTTGQMVSEKTTCTTKKENIKPVQANTNPQPLKSSFATPTSKKRDRTVYEIKAVRRRSNNALLVLQNNANKTSYVFTEGDTKLKEGIRLTNVEFETTTDKGNTFTFLRKYQVAA